MENSVDPDEAANCVPFHQDLYCLHVKYMSLSAVVNELSNGTYRAL